MIDRLEATLKRYNEIGEELASPEIISDIKKMTLLSKERTGLEKNVEVYKEYKKVKANLEEAKSMMDDPELKELAEMEYLDSKEKLPKIEEDIELEEDVDLFNYKYQEEN